MNQSAKLIWAVVCLLAFTTDPGQAASERAKKPAAKTAKTAKKPAQEFVFFPSEPAPPRLQFLMSFQCENDLGGGAGKFVTFLTGKEPPKKPILKPYGVAASQGRFYVCDTAARTIAITELDSRKIVNFTPSGGGKLRVPVNVAVDEEGTLYVADTGRNQVLVFDRDQQYQGAIGEMDEMKPTDVAIFKNRLYLTDLKNNCLRVYDKTNRTELFRVPKDPKDPKAKLFSPTNLAVDSQGKIYASDLGASRVQVYDSEGNHLRTLGQMGDRPGEFARPKGIAVDREGRIYVVDAAAQVVQIFDVDGRLLLYFGEADKNNPVAFDLPAKVVVDYQNVRLFQKYAAPNFKLEYLVIVTNQLGDRQVSVFGFGQKKS